MTTSKAGGEEKLASVILSKESESHGFPYYFLKFGEASIMDGLDKIELQRIADAANTWAASLVAEAKKDGIAEGIHAGATLLLKLKEECEKQNDRANLAESKMREAVDMTFQSIANFADAEGLGNFGRKLLEQRDILMNHAIRVRGGEK